MGFHVDALGVGFTCALVSGPLLLEHVLHFLKRFTRLRSHARLPIRRLPQLTPKPTYFSFGDILCFLCFGKGGAEGLDFLLQGCGCCWVGVPRSALLLLLKLSDAFVSLFKVTLHILFLFLQVFNFCHHVLRAIPNCAEFAVGFDHFRCRAFRLRIVA